MKQQITFPCMNPIMVPIEKVVSNDYNPNHVASPEMDLLARSIENNGLTYAITVVYDAELDIYIVVDGFHRYTLLKERFKCREVPVIPLQRDAAERMYSTVEFNRARGKHQVELMSALVAKLVQLGRDDIEIATELGMAAEEVLRLKQLTGLAAMFKEQHYSRAWVKYEEKEHEHEDRQI